MNNKLTIKEIEKLASEIVDESKSSGKSTKDIIKSKKLKAPLEETLTRNVNIQSFLKDFNEHKGDPQDRNVGGKPIKPDKPVEHPPRKSKEKELAGKKTASVIVDEIRDFESTIVSQVSDMLSIKTAFAKKDTSTKIAEKKEIEYNSFNGDIHTKEAAFSNIPTHRLRAAFSTSEEEVKLAALRYQEHINRSVKLSYEDPAFATELNRVYGDNKHAQTILSQVGVSTNNKTASDYAYLVCYDKRVEESIKTAEELYSDLVGLLKSQEVLKNTLIERGALNAK